MHAVILNFARKHKARIAGRVLDVGSYDVNGSLRSVLPVSVGVDMRKGPGVDEVVDATSLLAHYGPESFDCVCSADALEHMEDWRACMANMWAVLKPGGVFLLTMANPKKGRHAYPDDYWRFNMPEFRGIFGSNEILDTFEGGPSMGAIVVKSSELDLSIEPMRVP